MYACQENLVNIFYFFHRVCYLAGEYARMLQKNHPTLMISDVEILHVEIAGLCHDLGKSTYSLAQYRGGFSGGLLGSHEPPLLKLQRTNTHGACR